MPGQTVNVAARIAEYARRSCASRRNPRPSGRQGRRHAAPTGHTGEAADGLFPEDHEAQIRGTFVNIAPTLAEAGASWTDVVSLATYHVGLRAQTAMLLKVAADFLDVPYPAWTAVGVTELWPPEAVIEPSKNAS